MNLSVCMPLALKWLPVVAGALALATCNFDIPTGEPPV